MHQEGLELGEDLKAALAQPIGSKPSPETWRKGRWRAHVGAVEALALGQADLIQQALAFLTLQVMHMLIIMIILSVLSLKRVENNLQHCVVDEVATDSKMDNSNVARYDSNVDYLYSSPRLLPGQR